MLTSPKGQDGFSKILSVSDLQKLKSPAKVDHVDQAETSPYSPASKFLLEVSSQRSLHRY